MRLLTGHLRNVAVLTFMLVWMFVGGLLVPKLNLLPAALAAEEDLFEKYEIRVIRPRYFAKRKRIELGTQLNIVMNQTFIYSYLMSGIVSYHFTEWLAFEINGAYGISVDKDDKKILAKDFDIKTQILRPKYLFTGSLIYTPIYGKYQTMSGGVIYFDTFLSAGAGMTGVEYLYDHCTPLDQIPADRRETAKAPPAERTVGYPTLGVGIGQKFYVNKRDSIRWDVRNTMFNYAQVDGACDPDGVTGSSLHQNVTMQLGVSRFF
jgi:outer membrane beta-barrel protein